MPYIYYVTFEQISNLCIACMLSECNQEKNVSRKGPSVAYKFQYNFKLSICILRVPLKRKARFLSTGLQSISGSGERFLADATLFS